MLWYAARTSGPAGKCRTSRRWCRTSRPGSNGDPRSDNAARAAAASSSAARETKARRDRKICGAQNTEISASAPTETESAARAATCAGRDFRAFASSSANQNDPTIVDELA
jgi:hypothetical protein